MMKLLFFAVIIYAFFCNTAYADMPFHEKLEILQKVYAEHIHSIENNFLIMKDGTRIAIDDKLKKTHQLKLGNADIEDMLSQTYPVGKCYNIPPDPNFDPGRIRSNLFFKVIYGHTADQVGLNTVYLNWFGQRLKFTTTNNAHNALKAVHNDISKYKELWKYAAPSTGTFHWRKIAGTDRLSIHSFAAAIDLNTRYASYWRWAGNKEGKVEFKSSEIPELIVNIFEKHGFIWGGKWYHYDGFHFEYRPELIEIGKRVEHKGC